MDIRIYLKSGRTWEIQGCIAKDFHQLFMDRVAETRQYGWLTFQHVSIPVKEIEAIEEVNQQCSDSSERKG